MTHKTSKTYNIYELIDLIREKPGMYIGDPKISTMRAFLNGYELTSMIHNIKGLNVFPPFWYFNEWAIHTYGWRQSTAGWANIILEENDRDEKKALSVFFDLLDEFKTLKPISIQRLQPGSDHMDFYFTRSSHANMLYSAAPYENIDEVLLVNFSHHFGYSHFLIQEQKVLGLEWHTRYRNEASAKKGVERLFGTDIVWEDLHGDLTKHIELYL